VGITLKKDEINLREEIANQRAYKYAEMPVSTWFIGDGVTTDFELNEDLEPFQVFDAGSLVKEGSGDEYTVIDNGFKKTISFAVAPTNLNDVCIVSYKRVD